MGRGPQDRGLRANRRIRVPEIRLIGPDGEQFGVFQTADALRKAQELGLDLVEIAPTARPPVCKIMDFGKYKYQESKRKHEAKKNQVVTTTKEVKMRPSTGEHDLEVKLNRIKKFLGAGHRAKVTVQFRGREMAHKDLGRELLKRVVAEMEEIGSPEQPPKFEGRFLSVVIMPGKPKSVGGKGKPAPAPAKPAAREERAGPVVEIVK